MSCFGSPCEAGRVEPIAPEREPQMPLDREYPPGGEEPDFDETQPAHDPRDDDGPDPDLCPRCGEDVTTHGVDGSTLVCPDELSGEPLTLNGGESHAEPPRYVTDAEAADLAEMMEAYNGEPGKDDDYPVTHDEAKRLIATRAALLEALLDEHFARVGECDARLNNESDCPVCTLVAQIRGEK